MRNGADMKLKFEGIEDETMAKILSYHIDILAWSWGAGYGRDPQKTKGEMQDISLTTYVGAEAPHIAKLAVDGNMIKKATFVASTDVQTITMNFENVVITSLSTGGSGGEERFTQNLSFRFEKIEYIFEEKKDGRSIGTTSNTIK